VKGKRWSATGKTDWTWLEKRETDETEEEEKHIDTIK